MDLQTIYDIVRDHLMNQGERSVDGYACAYRGKNGMSCAAGCLIPDELYKGELEGGTVERSDVRAVLSAVGIDDDGLYLLKKLQRIHDWDSPDNWAQSLYELAESKGLRP